MSVKDRLAKRGRPTATHPLRVEDDTAARAALAEAQASGDEGQISQAKAALGSCYEQLLMTALPPVDMEALLEAHQPTSEQRKRTTNIMFNPVTFVPALLAACIDSDITEEDWQEYVSKGPLSPGESSALFNAVWSLNYREPSADLPKE